MCCLPPYMVKLRYWWDSIMANGESQTGTAGGSQTTSASCLCTANRKFPNAFLSSVSHSLSSQGAAEPTAWGGWTEGAPTRLVFIQICELFLLITLLCIGSSCGEVIEMCRWGNKRGIWTHPQQIFISSAYPSRKAGAPCLFFPTVAAWQSVPSLDRLHPNACL